MNVFENMIFPRHEIVGAMRPPPGVKPNFINPESRRHEMIVINATFLTIGISFVLMRLWTRTFITRSLGWDDYTCVIATILIIGHSVGSLGMLKYGAGVHMWNVPMTTFRAGFLTWSLIAYTFYIPAMGLIKLSILLLYLRLFSTGLKTRYTIYGLIFFVASYTIAFEFSLLLGCQPVAKRFNRNLKGKCVDIRVHVVAQQIFNIVSDVLLFILPIPIAWRLQLPFRQKLAVMCVFTAGSMSCIASMVRMTTITIKGTGDITWGQFDGVMWSVIELNFALICSCMPAFKPFLQECMPFLRSFSSRIHSSQRYTSSNIKNNTTTSSSSSHQRDGRHTFHQCKAEFVELQNPRGDGDVERAGKNGGVNVIREVEVSIDEDERTVHSQV